MSTNESRNRFWFPGTIIFFRTCVALAVVPLLLLVLLPVLTGCASKNKPVVIDKSQIDLANLMVQDLDSPSRIKYFNLLYPGDEHGRPGTNVMCYLLKWSAADGEKSTAKLIALSGRNVQFTDGSALIATGRISGVVGGAGGPGQSLRDYTVNSSPFWASRLSVDATLWPCCHLGHVLCAVCRFADSKSALCANRSR